MLPARWRLYDQPPRAVCCLPRPVAPFPFTTRLSSRASHQRGPFTVAMNDATTSLLTEHFSYTPLVSLIQLRSVSDAPRYIESLSICATLGDPLLEKPAC